MIEHIKALGEGGGGDIIQENWMEVVWYACCEYNLQHDYILSLPKGNTTKYMYGHKLWKYLPLTKGTSHQMILELKQALMK